MQLSNERQAGAGNKCICRFGLKTFGLIDLDQFVPEK